MKKYDEYEKQPELKAEQAPATKVADKRPKKNLLLQTYFTSLLGLILCVSMFFGTSYAWFTSEVNNTANEIYVGTLKVGLYKGEACTPENSLATNSKKLFDSNIRWEPGYTALEVITVKNEGDLAFKYALSFTDGTLAAGSGASLDAVAKYFEVWVFNHRNPNHTYVKPASYEGISEANGWKYIGNLVNILNGEIVLEGNMVTVRQAGQNADAINPGTTDGVGTLDTYTIALHMNEDAKSDVMGHKIMLNVKLVAYQKASEEDAFGDQYDEKQAFVEDHEALRDAVNSGKQVIMTKDIIIPAPEYCLTMEGNSLDGSGYTIEYIGGLNEENKVVDVLKTSGGTITNLTIKGGKYGRALGMTELKSDLIVKNCTLSGERAFILNTSKKNDQASLSFEKVTFKGNVSYANAATIAKFKDCTFEMDVRPYGDSRMTDCTFTTEGMDVSELVKTAGETVELINCYYNGTLIENAKLTSDGTVVTCDRPDLLAIVDNRVVLVSNGAE